MKKQNTTEPCIGDKAKSSLISTLLICLLIQNVSSSICPSSEEILPCRCTVQEKEIHIWCSHSSLPQILSSIKAIETYIKTPIDELVLENNQLPALPGRFFGSLQIVRLMLRHNGVERVSSGWLNELENSLVEVFIVEPRLRSIPGESLNGLINLIAITIQSNELKYLPDFSGLLSLMYLNVQTKVLTELQPQIFRHLPKLQHIHINGGPNLNRLQPGLFKDLVSVKTIDLAKNGINWIHLQGLYRLPNLISLKLSHNDVSDVTMVSRLIKGLGSLKNLRLDHNIVNILSENSFVDLPSLTELYLNDNQITEIKYGAFYRTPNLKRVYLHNNHIKKIHPESFLQKSGTGIENLFIYHNEIERVDELRSLLDSLPTLKFLDISNNNLESIPFGELRGHGTLEQLHLNNNNIRSIGRDAFMAMPALRELRLRNNSLSENLPRPFWNLPGLMGLDLSQNLLEIIDSSLLDGLPSLRRLDLSENRLSKINPDAFENNPLLETLNISSNGISYVHPDTFRNLNRLFEVDASINRMTEFIAGLPNIVERISIRNNIISSLHPTIGKLPNLRMLDLSQNKIEHIPRRTFQMTTELRVLSLADNNLRSLDGSTFEGGERIELLNLQNNDLTEIEDYTFSLMHNLRNLNLNGNKLEAISDNMFGNNTKLEQLNLALNVIWNVSNSAFEHQNSLEYLDLSGNRLSGMSVTLARLKSIRDVDLSYNNIAQLRTDVLSAWKNVEEIRLSNNLITSIPSGTFQNLPKLQYLDLSSNEISSFETGAAKNLRELQELVLADNKIVDLKHRVFENLPNLLALHLQHNLLRFIAPDSFFESPSIVFLNLSNNNFYSMDNVGLHNMKNLEVLDLSNNAIRSVSTLPLRSLSWLVELKMDNNQICKVQGYPFEVMPRLRVLSLRNNNFRTLYEKTFSTLRGNIAILDLDGNPMVCSCTVQWLSAWLEETGFPYPGPTCQDGQLLRNLRTEKMNCTDDQRSSNYLPLYNEHGDVFMGEGRNEFRDECDALGVEVENYTRPLHTDSDYFYDQFVDYPAFNNTLYSGTNNTSSNPKPLSVNLNNVAPALTHNNPNIHGNIDLTKTLLNTSILNRYPLIQQPQSPFTFFGYPIPALGMGGFLGSNSRRDHGYTKLESTRGKVRMLKDPSSSELEKYLAQKTQYHGITSRSRGAAEPGSEESGSNENPNVFKTSLTEPHVQKGGFKPIMPEHFGGFIPMTPTSTKQSTKIYFEPDETDVMPVNNTSDTSSESFISLEEPTTTLKPLPSYTYYVTEEEAPTTTSKPELHSFERKFVTTSEAPIRVRPAKDSFERKSFITESSIQINSESEEILLETTTTKTILLIPPEEELQIPSYKGLSSRESSSASISTERHDSNSIEHITPRILSGRPSITKVFTAQTLQQYLPSTEEYSNLDLIDKKSKYEADVPVTAPYNRESNIARKDGMDWYYKTYKNRNRLERHERLENSFYNKSSIVCTSSLLMIILNYLLYLN
ncbi:protein artichoke [Episyrphus balteatus]|uniref:protein artichoke n=1 Tax=Episyrphus balteatus TaxID=286459 RepID=UPI002485EC5B|nr:protein artichoke [Episyrphus balteatus]XP_055837768.1 protein artichoke [Episyrphus balteatus]